MNRRRLLLMVSASIGALLAQSNAQINSISEAHKEARKKTMAAKIQSLFSNVMNAKAVGLEYLTRYPDKNSLEYLLSDAGLEQGHHDINDARFKDKVTQNHRRDFETGNTVVVNNWVLSRTEASLCAFLAIS